MVNNLGDQSEPFSQKEEPMESRDFSKHSIGKILTKVNDEHAHSFKFIDKNGDQIGDTFNPKYDDEELEARREDFRNIY